VDIPAIGLESQSSGEPGKGGVGIGWREQGDDRIHCGLPFFQGFKLSPNLGSDKTGMYVILEV
jgi:hypothetical protein